MFNFYAPRIVFDTVFAYLLLQRWNWHTMLAPHTLPCSHRLLVDESFERNKKIRVEQLAAETSVIGVAICCMAFSCSLSDCE